MQENEGVCKVPHGGSVSIVDVPGHERLRRALETHLKDSRYLDARCLSETPVFPRRLTEELDPPPIP